MTQKGDILGPLHLQDQVVVTKARHLLDGPLCIRFVVEIDESKPLVDLHRVLF